MGKRYAKPEKPQQVDEKPPKLPPVSLPPIGTWMQDAQGHYGQVVEHICRPNRPPIVRLWLNNGKHGSYLPGELRDAAG